MKTKPHLDPTLTEESSLIIDPETLTQWVDRSLPIPQLKSTDSLSEKFDCLALYQKEASTLSALLKEHFSPEIEAPAHTICKVMSLLDEEENMPLLEQADQPSEPSLPLAETATLESAPEPQTLSHPFLINLEELKPKRKTPHYFFPVAALFLLSGIVASILLFDERKDADSLAQEKNHPAQQNKKLSTSRSRSMDTSLNREALAPLSESVLTSGAHPTEEIVTEDKKTASEANKEPSPTEEVLEEPKAPEDKTEQAPQALPPKEVPQGVEL